MLVLNSCLSQSTTCNYINYDFNFVILFLLQNIQIILESVINVVKTSCFNNCNLIIYDNTNLVTLSCHISIETNL